MRQPDKEGDSVIRITSLMIYSGCRTPFIFIKRKTSNK